MAENWKCPRCGKVQLSPIFTNHCVSCNAPTFSSRLADRDDFPTIPEPGGLRCFACQLKSTPVHINPDSQSETLYVVGLGDILEIIGESGDFHMLRLPVEERGYVKKDAGIEVEMGLSEIKHPIGYARWLDLNYPATVTAQQPNGNAVTLYTLTNDDRIPIVEEHPDYFRVQLQSGLRGWVEKGKVVRSLTQSSLPTKDPTNFSAGIAGIAIAGLLLAGAIADDSDRRR